MPAALFTERLILAPHDESDLDFMCALNADADVVRFTGDGPLDAAQALQVVNSLQRQWRERRMGRLVLLSRNTGERVGWCGLKWIAEEGTGDLGYRFFKKWWGHGLATESARACLRYGFEDLGLSRIIAEAHADNARSIHVLEKLGFLRRGQDGTTTRWEILRPSPT